MDYYGQLWIAIYAARLVAISTITFDLAERARSAAEYADAAVSAERTRRIAVIQPLAQYLVESDEA